MPYQAWCATHILEKVKARMATQVVRGWWLSCRMLALLLLAQDAWMVLKKVEADVVVEVEEEEEPLMLVVETISKEAILKVLPSAEEAVLPEVVGSMRWAVEVEVVVLSTDYLTLVVVVEEAGVQARVCLLWAEVVEALAAVDHSLSYQ